MANSPYTLFVQQVAGPSLTAGTAASLLVPAAAAAGQVKPTIPANWMATGVGMTWDAWGVLTTAATPGTGLWDLRIGSVVAFTMATAVTLAVSAAAWPWHLHVDLTMRIQGGATVAQLWGNGYIYLPTSLTAWTSSPQPATGFALGTAFDSTVPQTFDAFFTESLGTATVVQHSSRLVMHNPNY